MVSVLASSAVDRVFEHRSGQTKDYKIGICCFSAKHATLRRKSKNWLARNQNNVSEWSDMSCLQNYNGGQFWLCLTFTTTFLLRCCSISITNALDIMLGSQQFIDTKYCCISNELKNNNAILIQLHNQCKSAFCTIWHKIGASH